MHPGGDSFHREGHLLSQSGGNGEFGRVTLAQRDLPRPGSFEQSPGQVTLAAHRPAHHNIATRRFASHSCARRGPHPRSAEYMRERKKQIPMCSLRALTCLQVQVLPRQGMVGPRSDSGPWPGETLVGASSAVNGRACRRRSAAGGDWSAALANVQAATLRENCRPEIASFSEASEEGLSEPPNPDRKGEGSHD